MLHLAPTLELTPCPMCGADHGDPLVRTEDLLFPGDERFQLVSCARCGHIYQNPRPTPEAIGRYYPEDYHPFLIAVEDEPTRLRRMDRAFGLHMRTSAVHRAAGERPGRLLDVGCATGVFLDGMRRLGWQVQGVEPSPYAVRYARERFGLDVFEGLLERAELPAASFDAITMWDVLEHVHEPRPVLAELSRLLRPGGVLVLSLPNPDSLEARLLADHWLGWDLPRHLNLFRPAQLRAHLAEHGMPVERIRSFTAGHAVMVMSLERRLRAAGHGPAIPRLLNTLPVRLLSRLYYSGPASWFNLSSIMVVFARRGAALATG
jgi:2-polyprenyl-3-methyl-5-hydroxy-6-metoxy-1,4-benzoquinol methylase